MVEAGRPKRVFSEQEKAQIERMGLDNCNTETIANALNIPVNTLKRHFGRILKNKRAEHRANLRSWQTELAKNNSQMAIFLGKNVLDQTDKQEIKTTQPPAQPQTEAERAALEASARVYKLKLAKEA